MFYRLSFTLCLALWSSLILADSLPSMFIRLFAKETIKSADRLASISDNIANRLSKLRAGESFSSIYDGRFIKFSDAEREIFDNFFALDGVWKSSGRAITEEEKLSEVKTFLLKDPRSTKILAKDIDQLDAEDIVYISRQVNEYLYTQNKFNKKYFRPSQNCGFLGLRTYKELPQVFQNIANTRSLARSRSRLTQEINSLDKREIKIWDSNNKKTMTIKVKVNVDQDLENLYEFNLYLATLMDLRASKKLRTDEELVFDAIRPNLIKDADGKFILDLGDGSNFSGVNVAFNINARNDSLFNKMFKEVFDLADSADDAFVSVQENHRKLREWLDKRATGKGSNEITKRAYKEMSERNCFGWWK